MSERPGNFNKVSTTKASIGDLEPDSPDEYYAEIEAKIETGQPTFKILNIEIAGICFIVQFYKDRELKAFIDHDWSKLYAESSEIFIVKSEEAFQFITTGKRFFSLDEAQDILLNLYQDH